MPKKNKRLKTTLKTPVAVAVHAILRLLPDRKAVERAAAKRRSKFAKKYKRHAHNIIKSFNQHLAEELAKFDQISALCSSLFSHEDKDSAYTEIALSQFIRIPLKELEQLCQETHDFPEAERSAYVQLFLDSYSGNNHCDHRPEHFDVSDFINPYDLNASVDFQGKNRRPRILYAVMERILYACMNPKAFAYLFFSKTHYKVKRWQEYHRQFRSEAREAIGKLLCVMVLYMDLTTLNVGYPKDGDFHGFSYQKLANMAGISKSRAQRAMRKIMKRAWVGSIARYQILPCGIARNIAPLRTFNLAFFHVLGLNAFMRYERGKRRYTLQAIDPDLQTQFDELEGSSAEKATKIIYALIDEQEERALE